MRIHSRVGHRIGDRVGHSYSVWIPYRSFFFSKFTGTWGQDTSPQIDPVVSRDFRWSSILLWHTYDLSVTMFLKIKIVIGFFLLLTLRLIFKRVENSKSLKSLFISVTFSLHCFRSIGMISCCFVLKVMQS
jgi:hypothetical protein